MATKIEIKTASVLAFERKLDTSDATFYSGDWKDRAASRTWNPVQVQEKSVRGTISNRLKAKDTADPTKLDAKIENPNLQTVDVAMLPADADTLKVVFTLRILPGVGAPSACNSAEYQSKLMGTVADYVSDQGFGELSLRYANNLANGRFLWRNRIGAEQIEVQVAQFKEGAPIKTWTFDALSFSLRSFEAPQNAKTGITELTSLISEGLTGKQHVLLQVTAFVRSGAGQEVFPSQELILDKDTTKKSKTLYVVNKITALAGMHSQKIGNAIRSIDTWYPLADEVGPIAAEPYGSVTTLGKAYRQPKEKIDFYSLLDEWVLKDKKPSVENQHFVMAILVRGGVFGDSGKE
jgi:CRISPR-associated protein Csy3